MLYAGVEIGFNDSILVTTEGQSEPAIVCVQVTSGVLQRNVSVYLDTINNTNGGRLFTYKIHIATIVNLYRAGLCRLETGMEDLLKVFSPLLFWNNIIISNFHPEYQFYDTLILLF